MSLRITMHAIDCYLTRVEGLNPREIAVPTSRMRARTQMFDDLQGVEPVRGYPTTAVLTSSYIAMIKERAVITVLGPNDSHFLPSYAVIDRRHLPAAVVPASSRPVEIVGAKAEART
jgi:hypothetical protein